MHITVEDQISPPGECGIGTLTQNRKGARMDMWLVVAMQRNSFGIPWVKEYLWIVSQGCNTEGFTWSARERLSHAVTSLSLYFQIVSTVFRTFHFYSAPFSMLIFSCCSCARIPLVFSLLLFEHYLYRLWASCSSLPFNLHALLFSYFYLIVVIAI